MHEQGLFNNACAMLDEAENVDLFFISDNSATFGKNLFFFKLE